MLTKECISQLWDWGQQHLGCSFEIEELPQEHLWATSRSCGYMYNNTCIAFMKLMLTEVMWINRSCYTLCSSAVYQSLLSLLHIAIIAFHNLMVCLLCLSVFQVSLNLSATQTQPNGQLHSWWCSIRTLCILVNIDLHFNAFKTCLLIWRTWNYVKTTLIHWMKSLLAHNSTR